MKPLAVINRGFGGSQIAHVNQYASEIILPYRPRAVVLYAGDNDLSWPWSKTPEQVFSEFQATRRDYSRPTPGDVDLLHLDEALATTLEQLGKTEDNKWAD